MSIPFTQYLRPDGRQAPVTIERPEEIETIAQQLIARGVRFEVEHLSTGEASFEAVIEEDGETVPLAAEVVENGPPVPEAVDRLVREAAKNLGAVS